MLMFLNQDFFYKIFDGVFQRFYFWFSLHVTQIRVTKCSKKFLCIKFRRYSYNVSQFGVREEKKRALGGDKIWKT